MKICYLADGESVHTRRWCTHFASLGHDVHLISFKNVQVEGVRVHYIDAGAISVKGGNWKVMMKRGAVRRILREISPDILHAQYATSYGVVGALTGFHPFIITALGTDVLISPQRSKLYRMLIRFALRRADWVTAMADHMRDAIIALGITPQKVQTVIFGIDPKIFNRRERFVPQKKFVLTSTRNFEPVYNIPLLIDALRMAAPKIPGMEVNLVGTGTQREMLEALVKSSALENIVRFHGKILQAQIADLLRGSHLFVSTSLSDGNNVSLNEAMACGAFSIATDIPANRQWISEGVNGFLVPVDRADILAGKILYVYEHYRQLERKAMELNDKLISQYALWEENMKVVEKKYRELSQKK